MNVTVRTRVALALVGLVAVLPLCSALAAAPKLVTTVEGITEYALDNGARVLLCPDPAKPTVTVNATYLVGSRHEGYGETGMAHLLEHMLFKGTPDHPQIWKELRDHGAQFNGSTWFDRTNYYETLPASDENLEFALRLEADRMFNSHVAKVDLESEFSVVRNEFEIGENDPVDVLSERTMSTAYLWHNYGKSTIGSREDIERVPIERLQAFYKKYYQPDNCVLIVAGRFDEKKALELAQATFGAIPRPTRVLEPTYTWEPVQDGEREVTLRRVGDIQAISVVYHVSAGAHPDHPAVVALAHVLDADQTGRLYRALVEPGLATRVRASSLALHDPGALEIQVEARTDQSLSAIRQRLVEVLDGLADTKFTSEEVERAKNASARAFNSLINDPNRLGISLSESAAMGDWRLMFWNRDRMAQLTPADVQRVAAHYLQPSNRTIGMFTPDKAPQRATIPATPDVAAMLKDYQGGAEVAKGAAFEASYAAIEAQTQRTKLPFGMKLATLPKETRNNRVNLTMNFRYGSEQTLKGRMEAAAMMGPMLARGTQKHTRRQIQDAFDALKAQVRIGQAGGFGRGRMGGGGPLGTAGVIPVSIECSRESLPQVLELVAEVLEQPAFPADEFQTLQQEALAGIEEQSSEPMALAMLEVGRRMSPYPPEDVRYVATLPEQAARIRAVTLEQVKAVYSQLAGASFAEAAAVGDFDSQELTQALTKHFAGWANPQPFARIDRPFKPTTPDSVVIETPDKANALFAMGTTLELRDDDPDYPALFMANYVLGASGASRFMNRIRQKEGLSYGCGTSVQASAEDRSGTFMGFGMCAPQNAAKAMACGREELDKLLKDGVSEQELEDAKSAYRQQLEVQLSNDAMVASQLAQALYLDRTLAFNAEQQKRIEGLAPADLPRTLGKHVSSGKLLFIRAGDFSQKQPSAQQATGS